MLSILIVNWNTKDLLRACLASILRYSPSTPFEIIVVDNASVDGSASMVIEEFPNVRLFEPGVNSGYALGNNLAFGIAKGEWLLTLNPDTEFRDDSLQKSLDELARHPTCGSLAVRLIGPGGETQKSVRRLPTLKGILVDFIGLSRVFPNIAYRFPRFDYSVSGSAPQPMGTFLLFRHSALATIGNPTCPFDENFPIFFNEVDLLKRLSDAGRPCWYFSGATVLHHHGASTKQVKKSMVWESHKSLVRYLWKHQRGFGRIFVPFVALAAYVSAFVRAGGYSAGFRP